MDRDTHQMCCVCKENNDVVHVIHEMQQRRIKSKLFLARHLRKSLCEVRVWKTFCIRLEKEQNAE